MPSRRKSADTKVGSVEAKSITAPGLRSGMAPGMPAPKEEIVDADYFTNPAGMDFSMHADHIAATEFIKAFLVLGFDFQTQMKADDVAGVLAQALWGAAEWDLLKVKFSYPFVGPAGGVATEADHKAGYQFLYSAVKSLYEVPLDDQGDVKTLKFYKDASSGDWISVIEFERDLKVVGTWGAALKESYVNVAWIKYDAVADPTNPRKIYRIERYNEKSEFFARVKYTPSVFPLVPIF